MSEASSSRKEKKNERIVQSAPLLNLARSSRRLPVFQNSEGRTVSPGSPSPLHRLYTAAAHTPIPLAPLPAASLRPLASLAAGSIAAAISAVFNSHVLSRPCTPNSSNKASPRHPAGIPEKLRSAFARYVSHPALRSRDFRGAPVPKA